MLDKTPTVLFYIVTAPFDLFFINLIIMNRKL